MKVKHSIHWLLFLIHQSDTSIALGEVLLKGLSTIGLVQRMQFIICNRGRTVVDY